MNFFFRLYQLAQLAKPTKSSFTTSHLSMFSRQTVALSFPSICFSDSASTSIQISAEASLLACDRMRDHDVVLALPDAALDLFTILIVPSLSSPS